MESRDFQCVPFFVCEPQEGRTRRRSDLQGWGGGLEELVYSTTSMEYLA